MFSQETFIWQEIFIFQESRVLFHVLGLKCEHCGSYNTCRTQEPDGVEGGEPLPPDPNLTTSNSSGSVTESSVNQGAEAGRSTTSNTSTDVTNLRVNGDNVDATRESAGGTPGHSDSSR
jgi:RING finger/CHY zinc finger protein 1